MERARKGVSDTYDWFYGGHVFIKRNTIRGIFDFCDSPNYSLLLLRMILWKYVTTYKGENKLEDAYKIWERSRDSVRRVTEEEKFRAFDFVSTRAAERNLTYDDSSFVCRLPRQICYDLCIHGCTRAEVLLVLCGCLQIVREELFTFRVCQARLASRFKLSQAVFSKAVKNLQERGLLIPLAGEKEEIDRLGTRFTFSCNKFWDKAFIPAPGFNWKDKYAKAKKVELWRRGRGRSITAAVVGAGSINNSSRENGRPYSIDVSTFKFSFFSGTSVRAVTIH